MEIFNFIGDFFSQSILLSLGIAIAIGLLFNRIVKRIGLPSVTGYLVAGVIIGPCCFQIIPETWVHSLNLLVTVALGFIAFSIGGEFRLSKLKTIGKNVLIITFMQALVTTFVVDLVLALVFGNTGLAICLGAIATATAPAATLMVVRQYNAKGPVSDILMPVVALDDAIGLIVFSVSISVANVMFSGSAINVGMMLLEPLLEIVLSLVSGAAIGGLLTFCLGFFHSRSNRLIAIIGAVFIGTAVADIFNLSSLLLCMSIGAMMTNLYRESEKMIDVTEHWTPVVLLLFFLISGAELDPKLLPTIGLLGALYLITRSLGKYFGAFFGAKIVKADKNVQKYLGVALLPQAGVAIGMSQVVAETLPPEHGTKIRAVVLCATLIYELVGPLLTKIVLTKAGEIEKGTVENH